MVARTSGGEGGIRVPTPRKTTKAKKFACDEVLPTVAFPDDFAKTVKKKGQHDTVVDAPFSVTVVGNISENADAVVFEGERQASTHEAGKKGQKKHAGLAEVAGAQATSITKHKNCKRRHALEFESEDLEVPANSNKEKRRKVVAEGIALDKVLPGEKPGDWICPGCSLNVYASKERCFKCGSNKVGEGQWQPTAKKHIGDPHEVFVKNLSSHTDEESLREHFATCGKIRDLTLPVRSTGKSKGFGWIIFKKQEALEAAVKLDGSELNGFNIVVEKARQHKGDAKGKGKGKGKRIGKGTEHELFVTNLSYETTEDRLKQYFGECGKVVRMHMPVKGENKCMGFAWITFADKLAFDTALDRNGDAFDGRKLKVEKSGQHKKMPDVVG